MQLNSKMFALLAFVLDGCACLMAPKPGNLFLFQHKSLPENSPGHPLLMKTYKPYKHRHETLLPLLTH